MSHVLEPPAPFASLTPREYDVMLHIAQGAPNKIIAGRLGISQRTVEVHRANIFRKLDIRNAVQLVSYVWRHCPASIAGMMTTDSIADRDAPARPSGNSGALRGCVSSSGGRAPAWPRPAVPGMRPLWPHPAQRPALRAVARDQSQLVNGSASSSAMGSMSAWRVR